MAPRDLPPGVYDSVVSAALDELLASLPPDLRKFVEPLDAEFAPNALARIVYERLRRTLEDVHKSDDASRLERQIELTNALLTQLQAASRRGVTLAGDQVSQPGRRLLAIVPAPPGLGEASQPLRPEVPVSSSELLVNGRHDFRLGTEVVRELASADSVDLLCSFLKWSGFRVIEEALRSFLERRPGGLRVLTTAYMGATEGRALDALANLGSQVRISYDTERTRLHAKAWLFRRASGFSTASIGSSNLSYAAMLDGLEWNVRLAQTDNAAILSKFQTVFNQYWDDPTFEPYEAARDRDRFDAAVRRQTADRHKLLLAIHVDPKPHQKEVLERLEAERERGHYKNLVVAATGTGKTFIAAFDYQRIRKLLGGKASLLFVAHRHEILEQSMTVFRVVLGDATFGERLGGGQRPRGGDHVFANIQSLTDARLAELSPSAYDVVIVDEFHHAAARTYDELLHRLQPKYLVGLTATPERTDGQSVLGWFDGRIAAELRLWKALDQGLLSPFQYFGISDGTDLRHLRWTPTGYDVASLGKVYTANDLWIRRVLQEVNRHVADPQAMRALGFCADIEHARFVAQRFNEAGLSSVAVSERTSARDRADALARLQAGDLRAVFSVDLFNEGIDIPDVDTVLFLRPTESATLFLQQLGRGLRRRDDKECLTVLDFIGNAHKKFRFDARYRAIVGGTRHQIVSEIERGFPRLPSGCSLQLDRVAQDIIVANIKDSLGQGDRALVEDLRAIGRDVDLGTFLHESAFELEDVYSRSGRSWTRLRQRAGLPVASAGDAQVEESLMRAPSRMVHIDDAHRLALFRELLASNTAPSRGANDATARMLFAAIGWAKRPLTEMKAAFVELWETPAVRDELRELLALLDDRRGRTWPLDGRLSALPLRVHGTYGLDEVMAALNERDKKGRIRRLREGVFHAKSHRADLLFMTLDKSEGDYSPTTMYRDFPLSPQRFHWESQNGVHAETPTGRRYVGHASEAHEILLFVRPRKIERNDVTAPYTFLGAASYESHTGGRPMAIVWQLKREMPAWLFQEIKVAAG